MYQLAPISVKPEVKASRSQHGQFQNKIQTCVDRVICEVEVVDMTNKGGKCLFNLMDKFFSYGLYNGDQSYWKFIREFLPKTEQLILKAEWGDVNDRRLSIAWLKDAFNKSTLAFQMMAFKEASSKKIIAQYYHPNSCIMNGGMLEAVCGMMEKLVTVQFAFYSRLNFRDEPAPAVVVQSSNTTVAKSVHSRRRLDLEIDNAPVIPNVAVPDPNEYMVGTPAEQEIVLDGLIRNRHNRNREKSGRYDTDKEESLPVEIASSTKRTDENVKAETFNEVLTKVSSRVRMEHLLDEPRSFDAMLHFDDTSNENQKEQETLVEGEEIADSGANLDLAMQVFVEQGEKIVKMYHVFDKFAVGTPSARLFTITHQNMYIVSKTLSLDNAHTTEHGSSNVMYCSHCIIPLDALESIDVCIDYQQFIFYPKAGAEFKFLDENIKQNFTCIGTGDRSLGRSILNTIQKVYEEINKPSPLILTTNSPQAMILKRYLSKELPKDPNEIKCLSLVFWKETVASAQAQGIEHSGYLFWRFSQTNWWRKPQNDFEQCFLLLRQDRKLYMFKDSTMKEGIAIYDLRNCTEILQLDQRKDYQWSFELVFPEGNLQLSSLSKEDLVKWMQLINSALTLPDEESGSAALCILTDTHIAVAQEGARCIHDGFIRTLVAFALTDVVVWIIRGGESKMMLTPHSIMIFRVDDNYEWLFFRTEGELDRMKELLSLLPLDIRDLVPGEEHTREAAVLLSIAQKSPEWWYKPLDDPEATEAHEN